MTTLQKIRTERGLSQTELAARAGVSQPTIFFIEAGVTKRPTVETIVRLAAALEIDPSELIAG